MDNNPISQIENKAAFEDLGKSFLYMYRGMKEEGASSKEIIEVFAFYMAAAGELHDREA